MVSADTARLIKRATSVGKASASRRTLKRVKRKLAVSLAHPAGSLGLSQRGGLKTAFRQARARKVPSAANEALTAIVGHLKGWAAESLLTSTGGSLRLLLYVGKDEELHSMIYDSGNHAFAKLRDAVQPTREVSELLAHQLRNRLPDLRVAVQDASWQGTSYQQLLVSWDFR